MLELYTYWSSELRLFVVQDTLMFALFCLYIGAACQWILERLTND